MRQRVSTKPKLAFHVMFVSDAAWSWSNISLTSQTFNVMKSCPKNPSISLMQVKCVQVFYTFLMGCVLQNSYPLVNSPLSFSSFINIFPMGWLGRMHYQDPSSSGIFSPALVLTAVPLNFFLRESRIP